MFTRTIKFLLEQFISVVTEHLWSQRPSRPHAVTSPHVPLNTFRSACVTLLTRRC